MATMNARQTMDTAQLTALAVASDPTIPAYLLDELATLVARQAASHTARERVALSVAAFSIFLDCLTLGLEEQAQAIMARLHAEDTALVA